MLPGSTHRRRLDFMNACALALCLWQRNCIVATKMLFLCQRDGSGARGWGKMCNGLQSTSYLPLNSRARLRAYLAEGVDKKIA